MTTQVQTAVPFMLDRTFSPKLAGAFAQTLAGGAGHFVILV